MASVILYMAMSLDGFITGPGDNEENPAGVGGMRLMEWLGPGPTVAEFRPTSSQSQTHHRLVFGVTFENVREPRVKVSALKSTTRTITRKPSVATATKCPESRIRTRPTSHAIAVTSSPATIVAARNPIGTGPAIWSRCTPASQSGRSER